MGNIAVCTEVPRERLKKSYHRSFNVRVGASHARMRYRDRIDKSGRLKRDSSPEATLFGTPGFIFRSLFSHAAGWVWSALRFDWSQAFFHETRVLYFASYIWTRRREEGITLWRAPLEIVRVAGAVLLHRRRGAAPHASRWPTRA